MLSQEDSAGPVARTTALEPDEVGAALSFPPSCVTLGSSPTEAEMTAPVPKVPVRRKLIVSVALRNQ